MNLTEDVKYVKKRANLFVKSAIVDCILRYVLNNFIQKCDIMCVIKKKHFFDNFYIKDLYSYTEMYKKTKSKYIF